jgi:hypothetical protein
MKKLLLTAMLTVMGISGSMLFAAEPTPKPTSSPATTAAQDAKGVPAASQPAKTEAVKTQAGKTEPAKTDAKGDTPTAAKADAPADADEKAPPPSAADKGPSPQRFTPSEQVRADFDVSFPVDI